MKMKNILYPLIVVLLSSCDDTDSDKLVTIKTNLGDMTVLLYDETPLHKANFIKLAESGDYDSTIFHRVIQDFMIQGGDIYLDKPSKELETARIDSEIIDGFWHKKGELAAARQGDQVNPDKKSSSCQFYIVQGQVWEEEELTTDLRKLNLAIGQLLKMEAYDSLNQKFVALQEAGNFKEMNELALELKEIAERELGTNLSVEISADRIEAYTTVGGVPHLDREYTVFGRVVEGLDVIDKIASVEKAPGDVPLEKIYTFMEVNKMSKTEITEKYGYNYPSAQ
ncbi:MAG: peptidylprolyl isomerase [Cytophagales bacterium]|nr:peptidylprolyl isomerase [Cytophagales bacterium]